MKKSIEKILAYPHHAYCLVTNDPESIYNDLHQAISASYGISAKGDPDFLKYEKGTFGIDDAHFIKKWGSVKPIRSNKICVIVTHSMTIESQNALLKNFESAPKNNIFILLTSSHESLLPTILSRFSTSFLKTKVKESLSIKDFLSSTVAGRQKMLNKIIDDKDKVSSRKFLDSLEAQLIEYNKKSPEKILFFLRNLAIIKKMNNDQRGSIKIILEHVIHFAPIIDLK